LPDIPFHLLNVMQEINTTGASRQRSSEYSCAMQQSAALSCPNRA
jgi:hypothetical protein